MTPTFVHKETDKQAPTTLQKRKPRRSSKRLRQVSEAQLSRPAFTTVRSRPVKFF